MQGEYLLALLRSLKAGGIHTALETCGQFPRALLKPLLEAVDLFLFDLKHLDDARHREATGCGNELALENFRALFAEARAARVTVRIPLIPGFNTADADIAAFTKFLVEMAFDGEVHLMPYHSWAKSKHESLGRRGDYCDLSSIGAVNAQRIAEQFAASGLVARVYG